MTEIKEHQKWPTDKARFDRNFDRIFRQKETQYEIGIDESSEADVTRQWTETPVRGG